jgi:hypothetical protein
MTDEAFNRLTRPPAGHKVADHVAGVNCSHLRPEMEALKATRGERARADLGDFYVVDVDRNFLVATHVDPEAYGRELGVLRQYEVVDQDG